MLSFTLLALVTAADAGVAPTGAAADAADFIDDVRLIFQVVTCQPGQVPAPLDAKTVQTYCKQMTPKFERFRSHWGVTARAFIEAQRPAGLPGELVYPFGGGDLMMALTAFPDATVITTMSLELAGDPRRLETLADTKSLEQSLKALNEAATTTLMSNDSKSVNLSKIQRGDLPGQLSMHLMGLALNDQEPVSVRFFRVEPDGSLHYFSRAEIDALDSVKATKLKASWKAPDFSPAFANVEVQFVPKGQPTATPRIHRHLGANLSDDGFAKAPGLLAHLTAKGRVSAMTKAASYLLWSPAFSVIRDWLVAHAVFMISDSTGVPPRYWKKAGCAVDTFGSFQKSFLGTWEGFQEELRTEFEKAKKLPMRFGYPDGSPEKRSHCVVVKCLADAKTP
ncbi:MAG: hypothetical protein Q8S33_11885 [Myxococcales bacterium]|nr:hypothetical protein [Myxococcales bacterium]